MDENITCILPPPLSEDDFDRLLNGEQDAAIEDHLAQCQSCKRRFDEVLMFENRLSQRLFRWDCPSSDQLGDYYMNMLAPMEKQRIENHVALCLECTNELKTLADFMADDALEPADVTQRIGRPANPFMPAAYIELAQVEASQGSVLRGANHGPVMLNTETDLTIFVEVQNTRVGTTLMGQLISEKLDEWNHTLVEVRQTGERNKYTVVSDFGDFQCEIASKGSIRLRFANNQSRIVDTPELFTNDDT